MKIYFVRFVIFLSILFNSGFETFSQSNSSEDPNLEETVGWILEKLNRYTSDIQWTRTSGYNFDFEKEYQNILISYRDEILYKSATILIPLKEIWKIHPIKGEKGLITGIFILTYSKSISYYVDNELHKKEGRLSLKLDFYEENLYERLEKSFQHLASFYPKKDEKF